ncbi:hypothetical protein [Phenylobacterium sp.]|uniref:hypothetical protein n=1 Tax=Phenylobacterium sp. TaxID=1871053 RepID=UPI0025D8B79D|nr:hypothetical protein [Phenylobacterium sp.]
MEALFTAWARVRGIIAALMLAIAAMVAGCGEITAEDSPDAGGGAGGAQTIDPGTGGRPATGTGGASVVTGTGGAPGTGGAAAAYSFCEPTEALTVDTASCQKLQPGGTYKNSMRDGYVCALCDPPTTGMAIKNLPCLYTNRLCTHACEECN